MRRGLTVLKMRGTWHEKQIREYLIDNEGMHIKEPFRGVHGILTGSPALIYQTEQDRIRDMFDSDSGQPD